MESFTLVLPLRDDALDHLDARLAAAHASVVTQSFQASYCERLGARPSKAVAAVVGEHAPLPLAKVKANLQSHGFTKNELRIEAPEPVLHVSVTRPVMSRKTIQRLRASMHANKECSRAQAAAEAAAAAVAAAQAAAKGDLRNGSLLMARQAADQADLFLQTATANKATCLQPFALGVTLADKPKPQQTAALAAALQSSGRVGYDLGLQQPEAQQPCAGPAISQDAVNELSEEFYPSVESLQQLQTTFGASLSAWYGGLSSSARGGVSAAQVTDAVGALGSQQVLQLLVTLLFWLHTEYVVASPDYPGQLKRVVAEGRDPAAVGQPRPGARARQRGGRVQDAVLRPEHLDLGIQLLARLAGPTASVSRHPSGTPGALSTGTSVRRNASQASYVAQMGAVTWQGSSIRGAAPVTRQASQAGSFAQPQLSSRGAVASPFAQPPLSSRGAGASPFAQPQLSGRSNASSQAGALDPNRRQSSVSSAAGGDALCGLAISAMQQGGITARSRQGAEEAAPEALDLHQARLVGLLAGWRRLEESLQQTHTGATFTLPVVLLALRSAVHITLTDRYSAWLRCASGVKALEQVHTALQELLDPCGWHSQLPMLHSSPAALELCRIYARSAHGVRPDQVCSTSAHVKAALGHPASPGARRLMLGAVKASSSGSIRRSNGRPAYLGATAGSSWLTGKLNATGAEQLLKEV